MRGDQLSRQWRLIQRLARSRAGVGLDELADDLECHRRTVYRDLDALQFAGFPVLSERRDGKVFYRFLDNFKLGDVPFTPDEILSLAFGEDLLRTLEGTVFHDSIRSALEKIRASLGPELSEYLARLGESFRVLPGPHGDYAALRDTIRVLNECVLDRRTVRIRYRTGGDTKRERARELDPYRVWYRAGALYVVGHDHLSNETRTFAVGRVRSIERTDQRFKVPASFDFDAWTGASFGVIHEPPMRVRILFDPRWADWVAERTWHPTQKLERKGRSLELTMEVGGAAEVRSWVLSFGAGAEVLEPEALREEVRAELARAVERYRDRSE
jgi:predicted DNA-binding transcriptional regulator YafY